MPFTADPDSWNVRLRTLFHKSKAAQDGYIKPAIDADLSNSDWEPAHEGDYGHQYDHRFGTFVQGVVRDTTSAEHSDPSFEPTFEWVGSRQEFIRKMEYWDVSLNRSALLAFRRVARSTDERTSLATLIPFRPATNSWILVLDPEPQALAALCGAMNSLVLDYCLRNSLSQPSIPQNVYEQLPFPRPSKLMTKSCLDFIVPRILELTYTSHSLAPFARDLGYDGPPFAWDEERRALLRAELDVFYARAYGLTRDELRYILDPAAVKGPDYPSETFRVLKEKELRHHGEYRTQRLVLEAWDHMEADGTFDALDLGAASDQREVAVSITLPPLVELKDDIWAWSPQRERKDRLRYAAQYALWVSDPKQDASLLRVLVACLAEPALLSGWLSEDERAHWVRLLGPEARPLESGVVRLHPDTNAAWRSAFERLITSGQLREDHDGGWVRGSHFDSSGLSANSPDAQRAAFALNAIRRIEHAQLRSLIVLEDNIIWEKLAYGT